MLLGFDVIAECGGARVKCESSKAGTSFSTQNLAFKAENLKLTLYWQVLAPPEIDYTVFVHIRKATGQLVAQVDRPPADGAYPTSLWEPGEIIKDEISLPLAQLEPDQYDLMVGMYDFMTGARLPVDGWPDDQIRLPSFEVGE